jgi:hypothetical protein
MTNTKLPTTSLLNRGRFINKLQTGATIAGLLLLGATHTSWAQVPITTPATRSEVKMDRDEFLRTHTYDHLESRWMLKNEIDAPKSLKSRAEVKGMMNDFLRNNRYDNVTSSWISMGKTPRDMGQMTREQVRQETEYFVRTHNFDEINDKWVKK